MVVRIALCIFLVALTRINAQSCNGGVTCIPLDDCPDLYSQIQKNLTPQLQVLLRQLHCGFEDKMPLICCPLEFGGSSSRTTVRTNVRTGEGSQAINHLPTLSECGVQNDERIVGGSRTDIDEHPWTALLRYDKPKGWGFYCGGVLISSKYVLTAAHCVKGEDLPATWRLTQVRLGEWNTSSSVDCIDDDCSGPPQNVKIERIIAHEEYNPSDQDQKNDIALLRLKNDVRFNDFVKPICLPTGSDSKYVQLEGNEMEVAGWGKTEYSSESDVKLKVVVPVVTNNQCGNVFSRVNRRINNRQICAGGNAGQDSCRGDSGGALMGKVSSHNNWFVFGVVSYGPSPCGTPGWPGVYTRVTEYVDWILSKIQP